MLKALRRAVRRATERVDAAESAPARAPAPRPFGLPWVETFLPHYLTAAPSQLHRDLAADLAALRDSRGQRRAYSAPRGSAKTTLLSKAYPLYCVLEGTEPLTLLLAETGDQAKAYLDAVKRELEANEAVRAAYPHAAGRGPVWQGTRIRTRNGCEVMARGSGGRILGVTAGSRRPTLVVVDDGNERGDAFSPTKRQRKLEWFRKDVLPVGEPGTNVVVAGTAIHREAIVCDLRRGGWAGGGYRALEAWPDRLDLWAEWERLRANLADPDRERTARAYYEGRRAEMDAGARVLWPERLGLYALMEYRATAGDRAFASEYQDDPGSPLGAEWAGELFERPGFWFDQWPDSLLCRIQALDPSKGEGMQADYQAHVQIGLAHDGDLYVDADLRQMEDVSAMIRRALRMATEWGADLLVFEDNNTLGFMEPEIERQMEAHPVYAGVRWTCRTNTDHKYDRIMTAGKYLSQGRVRVRNTPGGRLLVEQWREFSGGAHDDGPDAAGTALIELERRYGVRR